MLDLLRVFVSHSAKDAEAIAVQDALVEALQARNDKFAQINPVILSEVGWAGVSEESQNTQSIARAGLFVV